MVRKLKVVDGAASTEVIYPGNAHFAMIEKEALHNVDVLMKADMQAARLLLSLIRLMEPGSGGVVVISRQGIAELLDVSMPTVQRALKTLVEGLWVRRVRIGGAYALAINRDVAWVGPRGDLTHAVFQATVIAARSEQDALAFSSKPLRKIAMAHPAEMVLPIGEEPTPPSQPGLDGVEPLVGRTSAHAEQEASGLLNRH